ncbi:beta-N-acetylglucosaminidase domain-containing protein [uncultured Robinsoniella sp.]|uniref:beta-N-acetylglucosaminidase domain-containing protein n=1 Tax=uncultured Robinsoniella sp. TaxID=904190 RepID=UPI00374EC4C3
MMNKHVKIFISYFIAFVVLFTNVIPALAYTKPLDAETQLHEGYASSPDHYEIYPVPQSVSYDSSETPTEFTIGEEVNVVLEDGIDQYTLRFLEEILNNYNRNITFSNAVAQGKSNILLGIAGSKQQADQYAGTQVTVQNQELFRQTDGYLLNAKRDSASQGTIVILGKDTNAVYYGLATLQMMFSSFAGNRFLNVQIEDYASMATRGFIEGFYGGWDYANRKSLMLFARDFKMNTYVYASKTDPYHKNDTLYPSDELDKIRDLVQTGMETKVDYAWSIHISYFFNRLNSYPVGSDEYNSKFSENYEKLLTKFGQLYDAGVRKFDVLNDDFGAGTHAEVVRLLNLLDRDFIQEKGCRRMTYCPQGYNKAWSGNGQELETLKNLNDTIDIYWTGDDVNAPITQDTVNFLKEKTGHDPVFWLNYPVNEHGASGIYLGDIIHYARSNVKGLAGAVSNPSRFAQANKPGLFQLAALFWNNTDYENQAEQVFKDSFKYLQPEVYDAYLTIARNVSNCPGSGRVPGGFPESEYLEQKLDTVTSKILNGASLGEDSDVVDLTTEFDHIITSVQVFYDQCENSDLIQELDPWLKSLNDIANGGKSVLSSITAFQNGDTQTAWSDFATAAKALETQASYPTYSGSDRMALAGSKRLEPFVSKAAAQAKNLLEPYLNPNPSQFSPSFYGMLGGVEKNDNAESAKIFDGDPVTYASYQTVQEKGDYFGVDLGKTVPVHSLEILQGKTDSDHDYFHNGCLEYSKDGTEWTTIAPNVDTHKLSIRDINIKARYIRLRLTQKGTASKPDYWTYIREFTVNGSLDKAFGVYSNMESTLPNTVIKEDRMYHMSEANGIQLAPEEYLGIKMHNLAPIEHISCQTGDTGKALTLQYSENGIIWTNIPGQLNGEKARYVRMLNETDQTIQFDLSALDVYIGDFSINPLVSETSFTSLKEGKWENLFDGDTSTYALTNASQKKDMSIIIDLGATVPVYDIRITTGDESTRFYDAKFQISEDKAAWEDFAEAVNGGGDAIRDNIFYRITKNLDGKMGRYLRILITKDNENPLKINDIEINKTRISEIPEITGTLSGDLHKLIDKNITTVYTSTAASDGNDYLEYTLTENTRLQSVTILQDARAVSNAEVTAAVYGGNGLSEKSLGKLSAGINNFPFTGEEDVLSLHIKWPAGSIPTIFEILPVLKNEDISPEETVFDQDGKQINKLDTENFDPVTVDFNTSFSDLPLPESMMVTYGDLSRERVKINWLPEGYRPQKAGVYTLTGYPGLLDGTYNHAGLYTNIRITVSDDISDEDKYPDIENGNLILNGLVKESGQGLYPVKNAVDGSLSTRWEGTPIKGGASAKTSWISADLGNKSIDVRQINIKFYLKTYASDYEIQVSDDNAEWTTIDTRTHPDSDEKDLIDTITLDTPVTQRYIRLLFHSMNHNAAGDAVGIREWEVIGNRTTDAPSGECSCKISGLLLDNQSVSIPADQDSMDVNLDAAANITGDCQAEGHNKLKISYQYDILEDQTYGAILNEDVLTVSSAGNVTIKVTASITGSKADSAEANAVISVSKEADPPKEYYTITFLGGDNANGENPGNIHAEAGAEVRLPSNPYEKPGYRFIGWSDGNYTYEEGQAITMPGENLILTAQWEKVPWDCTCSITNLNLENQNIQIPAGFTEIDLTLNATAELSGDCQIPGHNQDQIQFHYEIQEDLTGCALLDDNKLTVSAPGTIIIKVTASLIGADTVNAEAFSTVNVTKGEIFPEKYTVSFSGGTDAVGENPDMILAKAGTQITLPQNPYQKTGYQFIGWSDGNITYQAGETFILPENNVSFTALWEKENTAPEPSVYTLTFHANGGTVNPASKTVVEKEPLGALPIPSRTGYAFLGWYTMASGGIQLTQDTVCNFKNNVTVYAHWQPTLPAVQKPAKPAGLQTVYSKPKAIKISWKKVTGAKGYIISRYSSKTRKWTTVKKTKYTSFKDTDVRYPNIYKYRVKAYNQSENVIQESDFSKTLATACAPSKTSITCKKQGSGKIKITWKNKVKADGFQIYMKTGRGKYRLIATKGAKSKSYTKSKLKQGQTYTFRLRSYKKVGKTRVYSSYSKSRKMKL